MKNNLTTTQLQELLSDKTGTLEELAQAFPKEWQQVSAKAIPLIQNNKHNLIKTHMTASHVTAHLWKTKIAKSRNNPKVIQSAVPFLVKAKIVKLTYKQYFRAVLDKANTNQQISFTRKNSFILKNFMQINKLRESPAPSFWLRFWWKFIDQKGLVLEQLKSSGIYSVYSSEFINGIKSLINDRNCLEVGAGDGTLTKFLKLSGTQINATDDYSWDHVVNFPKHVEKMSAKEAIKKYQASVVLCAWPPPENQFERLIFESKCTNTYILITSKHQYASGNWQTYLDSNHFEATFLPELAKGLFPSEADATVVVFQRT